MDDIFESELKKATVFQDRNVLSQSYIPETLPHREKEIERMMKTLAPMLSKKIIHNLFIYGKTGTGKSSSTRHILNRLGDVREKYDASVDFIYVNCHNCNTKYQVMLKCAEYCAPGKPFIGYPFSHLFEEVKKKVQDNDTSFLIVLDEVDKVKDIDELMYTLTRANDELDHGRISLIGITNSVGFKEQLDPRPKSTLCEEEMVFPPYNATELESILRQRGELGFKQGAIDESAINLAAALAAQESGDARYALKLILKAGQIADDLKEKRVTDSHVQIASEGVEEEIVYEIINTLPEHQKIVLYAITLLTEDGSRMSKLDGSMDEDAVLYSGEVYDKYRGLCKVYGKKARTARWCRDYLNDLDMMGLITTSISGKGIRGNTTLIQLAYPQEKVKRVLEKHFNA